VNVTPRPSYFRERDAVHIGRASGPVWAGAENLASTGIRSPDRPTRRESIQAYYVELRNDRYIKSFFWRVFENRVLKRIFGPKRDEATGDWRRLRNEELNDLYLSPSIVRVIKSRRMRWAGHVARKGEKRGAYRILMGRPDGRRPLGRPRRR
jgi:hypothetical protein